MPLYLILTCLLGSASLSLMLPLNAQQEESIYPNNLKIWEFGKEGPQNFCSERVTIADRQGASENGDSEVTPTTPKTNSSSCLGIDWREELRQIDEEIKETQDVQTRYYAEARRAEAQGQRWQFTQDNKMDAKKAFQLADERKQAAQMLQGRIDALNARRAQILQEHPNDIQRSP